MAVRHKQGKDERLEATTKVVRILKCSAAALADAKDEEYSYWQSRPPLERLQTMQELSFSFFSERANEAEVRRQFLRSPVCLPRV
jgi:hypothetical protein